MLLLAGLSLRVFFLRHHAFLAGDSYLYQDIAQNWLHSHLYGLSTDAAPRPTLIRLPGYPAILAALSWVFDRWLQADPGTLRSFLPVLWLQVAADLLTCCLAASTVFHMLGRRAGLAALALGTLCPFTANYTAVPLTETLTLLFTAVALWLLQQWLRRGAWTLTAALGIAVACGILLRPDQGLLLAAVLPVLLFGQRTGGGVLPQWKPAAICLAVTALPFVPWTARNLHTFHVFQPLAPRLANDPGEVPSLGYQAWYRTWAVDFSSTEDAYWKYPEEAVQMSDLPDRAFDSPNERNAVAALLQQTAATHTLLPAVEQQFAALALRRRHRHPLRTEVLLPGARLLNMLLHPRTEMLPVVERWWQYRAHPKQTVFAWTYAALNLAYFAAAAWGFRSVSRFARPLTFAMLLYIVLRSLLLLTLDNAEQRYTLEFFPLLFIFGGALWTKREPA